MIYFFFFSSRRRHTRLQGDWSSDVCSSDLGAAIWLEYWGEANRAADQEAEFAIRQIGTNSIPLLLDLIRTQDPVFKKKLRSVVPQRWHDKLRLRDNSGTIRRVGAHGLAALGTNAAAAVPAL